ncbi:MAG: hypothetical protein HY650_12480 [Acidobacteria bacterium]|nr:hypothetical protein [Acidobacteriota bacterium]
MRRSNLSRAYRLLICCLLVLQPIAAAPGQEKPGSDRRAPEVPVADIIQRFAANESRLRQEYRNYLYKQDVTLQTLTSQGGMTGEFRRTSEIVVDDRGQREERILYFPQPTLAGITVTQADYNDLAGIQPFALAKEDLAKYKLTYVGREKIDELDTYIFDVAPSIALNPKKIEERYFEGRIWVDTVDLTIVKVEGRGVPQNENNQFPKFETYRENIAPQLWFPTYTHADDVLQFRTGPIRLRMIVRYTDYRRFTGKIELGGESDIPPSGQPDPAPKAKKP